MPLHLGSAIFEDIRFRGGLLRKSLTVLKSGTRHPQTIGIETRFHIRFLFLFLVWACAPFETEPLLSARQSVLGCPDKLAQKLPRTNFGWREGVAKGSFHGHQTQGQQL